MVYKLICSDIDGTLLNKNRALSNLTISEIKRIKDIIPIILVSSRMPKAMTHLQVELGIEYSPLIAYNGGLILTSNPHGKTEVLSSIEVSNSILDDLLVFNDGLDIHTSLYHNDEWYVSEMDYWANREQNNTKVSPEIANLKEVSKNWNKSKKGPHKIMCMGDESQVGLLADYIQNHYSDQLNAYRSKPTYLEISSKRISKLSALEILIKHYDQISLSDVVAFGDNYNDVDMIQGVGLGVAMDNAKDEVKAVSNRITRSNIEDGVALLIKDIF